MGPNTVYGVGGKDLDVYSFYAKDPKVPWPYRRHGKADFGESEFGYYRPAGRPNEYKGERFVGRPVDLLGRALPVEPDADPVQAVRDWLATSNNATPRLLRLKAVVGLYPANTAARSRYRSNGGRKAAALTRR